MRDQKEAAILRLGEDQSKQKEQNGQRPEVRRILGYLKKWKKASVGGDNAFQLGPLSEGPQVYDPKDEPIWIDERIGWF